MENLKTTKPTLPMRIMVGLDGLAGSERALEWAIEMASATGAEILAVHVFQPVTAGFAGYGPVAVPDDWAVEVRRLFENDWVAPLRDAGVRYRTIFEEGVPAPVLIDVAAEEHADLIVTGNRGLGGFRELMLGSVSQQLVLHARVPVVIIPAEHKRDKAISDQPGQEAKVPIRAIAAP